MTDPHDFRKGAELQSVYWGDRFALHFWLVGFLLLSWMALFNLLSNFWKH